MALFEEAALSALLFNAFKALGPGPQRREIATVAKALRESGDEEVQALLGTGRTGTGVVKSPTRRALTGSWRSTS
jgi:hypothetical protein